MIVKLLTDSKLKRSGCSGSSESTLVKIQIVGNLMPRLILFF